mmetsp:Transcript_18305/g.62164  ORF Transcript_18305/g.62164 Transcript_18305/m.62164 type:complete len:904 (-) Transcript_18305:1085-3796(-)
MPPHKQDVQASEAAIRELLASHGKLPAGSRYDVVLVLPRPRPKSADEGLADCGKDLAKGLRRKVNKLRASLKRTFDCRETRSRDGKELYLRLGMSPPWLMAFAEEMRLHLPVSRNLTYHGVTFSTETGYEPFSFELLRDHFADSEDLTVQFDDDSHYFGSGARIRVISAALAMRKGRGGLGLDMAQLMNKGVVLRAAPLHDVKSTMHAQWLRGERAESTLDWFQDNWVNAGSLLTRPPWAQPFKAVQQYFGPQVAFYFAWAGHYTKWIAALAPFGLVVFICQVIYGNEPTAGALLLPLYSVVVSVWAPIYMRCWMRQRARHAFDWGMDGFSEREPPRASFAGQVREVNFATGEFTLPLTVDHNGQELYYSPWARARTYCVTVPTMVAFMALVCATSFLISLWREQLLTSRNSELLAMLGPSVASVIFMVLYELVYKGVASVFNSWENHRTQSQYDNALIFKHFAFDFVNNYFPLILITFFESKAAMGLCEERMLGEVIRRTPDTDCSGVVPLTYDPADDTLACVRCNEGLYGSTVWGTECTEDLGGLSINGVECTEEASDVRWRDKRMEALTVQLGTALIVKGFVLRSVKENVIPWVKKQLQQYMRRRSVLKTLSKKAESGEEADAGKDTPESPKADKPEVTVKLSESVRESLRPPYGGVFDEYKALVIQFGFVVLFAPAFPLGAGIAAVANSIEVHLDAKKVVNVTGRPFNRGAEDIGAWRTVLEVMSTVAIVTNCALVAFVSNSIEVLGINTTERRLMAFIAAQNGLFLLRALLFSTLQPESDELLKLKAKQELLVSDEGVMDADEDEDDAADSQATPGELEDMEEAREAEADVDCLWIEGQPEPGTAQPEPVAIMSDATATGAEEETQNPAYEEDPGGAGADEGGEPTANPLAGAGEGEE